MLVRLRPLLWRTRRQLEKMTTPANSIPTVSPVVTMDRMASTVIEETTHQLLRWASPMEDPVHLC